MVPIVVVLFLIAVYIMSGSSPFQYKCFLLTLENETLRRERFFKNHDPKIYPSKLYTVRTRGT